HRFMSLKILLGKFVAFFAGQIPVEGQKNIIDSFQKLIVSPKRFICVQSEQLSQLKEARSISKFCQRKRPLECSESLSRCFWPVRGQSDCRPFAPNQVPFKEDRGFIEWLDAAHALSCEILRGEGSPLSA